MIINPIIPIWIMVVVVCLLMGLKRKGIVPNLRKLGILIILFLINLRIMIPDGNVNSSTMKNNISVVFVIDNTISMLARDYQGENERLKAVKADAAHIIEELYGAEFSVITFDNNAKTIMPFHRDADFANMTIEGIRPLDELYARGSSINVCKDVLLEQVTRKKEKSTGPLAVFFFSDGENNTEEKIGSFSEIASYVDCGAVLGYGTEKGGKMYVKDSYDGEESVLQDQSDYPWGDAISKIDEGNLKQLAGDMGIPYVNMSKQENVDDILKSIKKQAETLVEEGEETEGFKDTYYWFVLPLLLLLVVEFRVCMRQNG